MSALLRAELNPVYVPEQSHFINYRLLDISQESDTLANDTSSKTLLAGSLSYFLRQRTTSAQWR
jgi:hypothetical protein